MTNSESSSFSKVLDRLGVLGGLIAGVLGLLVSTACVAVPGLHFVIGPFGPLIGGFVIGRFTMGVFRRGAVGVATMAVGMAAVAAAFTGALFGEEPSSGLARAAPVIVFVYTALSAAVGAFFGAATAPRE
jgi:hypothetical protein